MKKILFAVIALAVLTACNKDNDDDSQWDKSERTVLIYISGENSLWDYVDADLSQMKQGSMDIGNNCLLVYVDHGNMMGDVPWLARIKKGQIVDSVSITTIVKEMNLSPAETAAEDDPYASEAQVMEGVVRYAFKKYPSKNNDYAMGFWGHGSGWLMKDSLAYTAMARKKAYGVDNGRNTGIDIPGKWMNLPTMAKMLSKLPHLTFMFFDCCNMMCLENAYELRNVTDYLIGSPAEIPGVGAPYQTVVPAMFEKTTFWKSIVDRYYEQSASGFDEPLSVVKTSEMGQLASATRTVLKALKPNLGEGYPDMSGVIHYYYDTILGMHQEFYDANDFVLKFADKADYDAWKQALDRAVIYKKMATSWMIDAHYWNKYYGNYFEVTEEKFGGVSMFVPTYIQQYTDNNYIQQMGWYYAAGYNEIGW